jgi:hypothetical protein
MNSKLKLKTLTPLAATLLISACATTSPTFIVDQKTSAARDLGIAPAEIVSFSRCEFGETVFGNSAALFRPGVCTLTKDNIVVRAIDATSNETRVAKTVPIKDIESISLHSGIILDQIHVRTKDNILAMHMRPDGGVGLNNVAAKEYFAQLKLTGVREIEAKSAIRFAQYEGGTSYVPIYIAPRKK